MSLALESAVREKTEAKKAEKGRVGPRVSLSKKEPTFSSSFRQGKMEELCLANLPARHLGNGPLSYTSKPCSLTPLLSRALKPI